MKKPSKKDLTKARLLDGILALCESANVSAEELYGWARARDLRRAAAETFRDDPEVNDGEPWTEEDELEAVCDAEHDPARDTVNFMHDYFRDAFALMKAYDKERTK